MIILYVYINIKIKISTYQDSDNNTNSMMMMIMMMILTELKNKDVPKNKPLKSNKKQIKPIANAAYRNRKKLSLCK
jgi:hypothetical protein